MDEFYGTMTIISENGNRRKIIPSHSVLNARVPLSLAWLSSLWDHDPHLSQKLANGVLFFQFSDWAHNELCSVAYGRRLDNDPIVRPIPDAYFFLSRGYRPTRSAIAGGELPKWEDRQALVFWRGTATFKPNASTIREPSQIPRIALCLRLKWFPRSDVAIRPWDTGFPEPAVVERFIEANSISGPHVPMLQHANYKFQIDIDGAANAWGFFDKLLMGSCILKIQSQYEQWFYSELRPWEHYVPIKADLSDLETQLDWCFAHDADAKAIGQRGQEFALEHTYERGVAIGREAIAASFINL